MMPCVIQGILSKGREWVWLKIMTNLFTLKDTETWVIVVAVLSVLFALIGLFTKEQIWLNIAWIILVPSWVVVFILWLALNKKDEKQER